MSRFFLSSAFSVGMLSITVFTQCAMAAPPSKEHSRTTLAQAPAATLSSSKIANEYLTKVKEKILRAWTPAKADAARVSVKFKVDREGTISNVQLQNRSDVEAVNHSALDALVYCGNLPPVPSEMPQQVELSIEFNSEYNPTVGPGYLRPGRWALEESAQLLQKSKSQEADEAVQGLKKAIKLNPYDRRIKQALVKIYMQQAKELKGEAAIEKLHLALLQNPKSDKVRAQLNELYTETGKAATFDSHLEMARKYVAEEKYEDALCEYGEAWKMDNQSSLIVEINATCKLAQRLEELKKWDTALQEHDTAQIKQARDQARLVYEPLKEEMKLHIQSLTASSGSEGTVATNLTNQPNNLPNNLKGYADSVNLSAEFPYSESGLQFLCAKILESQTASQAVAGKKAEKAQVATLIDFYADWCPPCRMISPNVEAIKNEFKGKVKVVRVNIDQNKELAMQWGVRAVPYLVLVKPDNRRTTVVGYRDINYLRAFVQQGLSTP